MKFVILADAHLLQSFSDVYNSLSDFERVLDEVADLTPDYVLIAGDMWDEKKTQRLYVRHPEGEKAIMTVRRLFSKLGIPIYAIRGNHEDERVLEGLDQTVSNFHYVNDDWVRFGKTDVYFMNTRWQGFYDVDQLDAEIDLLLEDINERSRRDAPERRFLVCHETFIRGEAGFPKDFRERLLKAFDLVLNGHLHFYGTKVLGEKNLVCLPSLLPSRVLEGKYWEESYTWPSNKDEYTLIERESPFGFVELNVDGKAETSFHRFKPSVKVVDVNIDATDLDQGSVRGRFKDIFNDIQDREDVEDLIVVPRVTGSSSFSVSLLRDIPSNYPMLIISSIRDDTIQARSPFVGEGRVETIILTPEDLGKELLRNAPMMAKALREQGIAVKPKDLKRLISRLLEENILEKGQKRVSNYVFEVLQRFSNELEKEELIESLPEDFGDFLRRRCEEAL